MPGQPTTVPLPFSALIRPPWAAAGGSYVGGGAEWSPKLPTIASTGTGPVGGRGGLLACFSLQPSLPPVQDRWGASGADSSELHAAIFCIAIPKGLHRPRVGGTNGWPGPPTVTSRWTVNLGEVDRLAAFPTARKSNLRVGGPVAPRLHAVRRFASFYFFFSGPSAPGSYGRSEPRRPSPRALR